MNDILVLPQGHFVQISETRPDGTRVVTVIFDDNTEQTVGTVGSEGDFKFLKDLFRAITNMLPSPSPSGVPAGGGIRGSIEEILNWMIPSAQAAENGVDPAENTSYLGSRNFAPRRDPLAFDLDGDGLETTAIGNPLNLSKITPVRRGGCDIIFSVIN